MRHARRAGRRSGLRAGLAVSCSLGLLAAGCTVDVEPTNPAAAVARPLTVGTFGRVTSTDPASATDTGSTVYALNVFQRLMTVEVGSGALKPDAATDCWYIDEVTYSCGIRRGLTFTNGNELTATDVKFSLERARNLNVAGSSARLLDNIERIVIPDHDPLRVDITLKQHDRTLGYALASPAASLVDEDTYAIDELSPPSRPPVGSGPFIAEDASLDEILLKRHPGYQGAHWTPLDTVTLKTFSTRAALERTIATRTVDVLWRAPADMIPQDGSFRPHRLPGATVQRLEWNPRSPRRDDPAMRAWVRDATGELRTLASAVPRGVQFAADTFAADGRHASNPMMSEELMVSGELTVGYDGRLPGQLDLARRVQEALAPVGVRLVEDGRESDLWLSNGQAWTNTTMAWLQPYVESPLPGREAEVRRLELAYRESDTLPDAERTARELQEAVAADATIVPLTQSDEVFWTAPGITLDTEYDNYLGPCYQLGLWGFVRE